MAKEHSTEQNSAANYIGIPAVSVISGRLSGQTKAILARLGNWFQVYLARYQSRELLNLMETDAEALVVFEITGRQKVDE